jgi:ABC-type protease/lipase transport system fused ATPase/permease subunit
MARHQWETTAESANAFSAAPASSPNEETRIVLRVDSITKQCTDPAVLVDVGCDVQAGEIIRIIGQSSAGSLETRKGKRSSVLRNGAALAD